MTATVVVTDGEQRAALATVRSLGRAGHRVHVCSASGRSLAGASRHAAGEIRVPDPLAEPTAFADALARHAEVVGADVVLPITEPALLAVLPVRERFRAAIPFPPAEAFARICDKRGVLEAARAHGIASPEQRVAASRAEAAALGAQLRYPLVLKPSRSVAGEEGARVRATVVHVDGPGALEPALARIPGAAWPLLMQERVVGPGMGIFVLLWGGEVVASFAHRRLRERPPSGGMSVLSESVAADPALLARSVALLRGFGWEGVAMVEYKVCSRTGTPYLMEVNGRLWGSLQLAVDAGVDFPALLVELATGGRPAPVAAWRPGVRNRWDWGDVDHLIARLRHSRRALALPPEAPGRLRALLDFVRAFAPANGSEALRRDDPRPFWRESADWLLRR